MRATTGRVGNRILKSVGWFILSYREQRFF
jgi:hypothetical protein